MAHRNAVCSHLPAGLYRKSGNSVFRQTTALPRRWGVPFVSNLISRSLGPADSPGALLVRRLVPATIGIPIAIGLLRFAGEHYGLYSAAVGVAIMVAFSCVGATVLLAWTAASLNRIDRERLRVAETLRQATDQHRTLARNFPEGAVVLFDRELRHVIADGLGLASVGLSREQMEGRTIWQVFPAEVCAAIEPSYREALAGRESTFEYVYGERTFFVRVIPVRHDVSGSISGGAVMVHEITTRKRSEDELREASERFEKIFDNAPIGEAIVAPDGRWLQVNQALCDLVGFSRAELLTKTFQDITHPDDLDADLEFTRQMLAGEIRTYEMEKRYLHKEGRAVWVLLSVSLVHGSDREPLYFISQVQDISERKRAEQLEEQLRHSQKLDAIGQLAGGVAHEFNNMLMAIHAYSDLLLERLEHGSPLRSDVEQISRAAERSRSLTQQLLAFGRRQLLRPSAIDLNELLGSSVDMLRPLLGAEVELVVEPDPAAGAIWADPAQIEQAIINLVLNARDAVENRGRITISTRIAEVDAVVAANEAVSPGSYVVLTVADDGVGIDEQTRGRMFEPFFTTKASGSGSGLGLSTVHGIIRQSGGFITVGAAGGGGASISLLVPQHAGVAVKEQGVPEVSRGTDGGTALLVEDEELVRDVCAKLFAELGWTTLTARSGQEALEVLRQEQGRIDLLLTDMVMPGMTGRELGEAAVALHPELTVIHMSGYTGERFLEQESGDGSLHFLQKPFSRAELQRKVREALECATGSTLGRRKVTCVVADDHPTVVDAVCRTLRQRGIRVLAGTANGEEALTQIRDQRPDVALLDIEMPKLGGIEAARRLRDIAPGTRLLLYTGNADAGLAKEALDAGAHGLILKDTSLTELARALEIVAEGGEYLDSPLSGSALPPAPERAPLTTRERAVLRLLAEGHTNDQAGAELSISPDTVQTHVRNAMKKLGADTRTQAVATALRQELIA
jgi:two-component system cell cycle sensor histidine kinase/response regulator CckA